MGEDALMCVHVRTMPTVTPRTERALAPRGGWGPNVISHAGRGNMVKTVNMTASAEMGRNVIQRLESVIVPRGGEGSTATRPALWGVGGRSANSNVAAGMGALATM